MVAQAGGRSVDWLRPIRRESLSRHKLVLTRWARRRRPLSGWRGAIQVQLGRLSGLRREVVGLCYGDRWEALVGLDLDGPGEASLDKHGDKSVQRASFSQSAGKAEGDASTGPTNTRPLDAGSLETARTEAAAAGVRWAASVWWCDESVLVWGGPKAGLGCGRPDWTRLGRRGLEGQRARGLQQPTLECQEMSSEFGQQPYPM